MCVCGGRLYYMRNFFIEQSHIILLNTYKIIELIIFPVNILDSSSGIFALFAQLSWLTLYRCNLFMPLSFAHCDGLGCPLDTPGKRELKWAITSINHAYGHVCGLSSWFLIIGGPGSLWPAPPLGKWTWALGGNQPGRGSDALFSLRGCLRSQVQACTQMPTSTEIKNEFKNKNFLCWSRKWHYLLTRSPAMLDGSASPMPARAFCILFFIIAITVGVKFYFITVFICKFPND